jgi:GNAT superfamily N-acetyltransferase
VGRRDWAQVHFAAEVALLRHLATSPLAERGTGDVSWAATQVASNTHNGVTDARLTHGTVASVVAATVECFTAQQLPATWFVTDDSTPADLGVHLQAAGCRAERSAWVMGADLVDLRSDTPRLPEGVVIEEVTGDAQLHAWFQAAGGVTFDDDDTSREHRLRLYASLGLGAGRPWRHWLATEGGRPVGTASALFTGPVVALDNIGVVPTHRRRGLGGALTLAPVTAARRAGLRVAVLGPSPDGQPLYEELGFELAPALADRAYYLPLGD